MHCQGQFFPELKKKLSLLDKRLFKFKVQNSSTIEKYTNIRQFEILFTYLFLCKYLLFA